MLRRCLVPYYRWMMFAPISLCPVTRGTGSVWAIEYDGVRLMVFEKILVPTDGSEYTKAAVKQAF